MIIPRKIAAPQRAFHSKVDSFLIAHARPDGKPHDWKDPEHGGIRVPGGEINPHGQRGSNTWPDGTSKTDPRYNQGGRTFADGTPLTSKNYAAFKLNPDIAPSN